MRLISVCALLSLPLLLAAESRRLGDDGFRVGQEFSRAVLSPDGRVFAVGGRTGGVHVLDAATGRVRHSFPDRAEVKDLAFDPAGDLLVLDCDGWLRAYDTRRGELVREVLIADPGDGDLRSGRFYPGGHFVEFTNDWPRQHSATRLLDTARSERVDLETVVERPWTCSPDGRFLAVLVQRGGEADPFFQRPAAPVELLVLDRHRGAVAVRVKDLKARPEIGRFRPDGKALLYALDGELFLLDVATGRPEPRKLEGWTEAYRWPVWSPDGRRVAMERRNRDESHRVREWDLATGRLLRDVESAADCQDELAYTPDGRLLQWNTSGVRLHVREVGRPAASPWGHPCELADVVFASNDTLATLDRDGNVIRWDVRSGALLNRGKVPTTLEADSPPVEKRLVAGSPTARLTAGTRYADLDLATGQVGPLHDAPARPEAISPDGRWMLDWGEEGGRLFDTKRGRAVALPAADQLWPSGMERAPFTAWSPDGRLLALCQLIHQKAEGPPRLRVEVAVVKPATGRLLSRVVVHADHIDSEPIFTPDGALLLLQQDGQVVAYDTATGRAKYRHRHPAECGKFVPLACSPDGRLLLTVAEDGSTAGLELWLIELLTGSPRRKLPLPAGFAFARPRFSPDGRTLALGLSDATVLLLPTDIETSPTKEAALWDDLAARDAAVAGAAVRTLASRSDAAAWVRDRLVEPAPEPDLPAVFWLAELEHDDFERREAARRRLARSPELLRQVEAALVGSPSSDLARTLADLAADRFEPPTADDLRRERIREALDLDGRGRRPTP